MKTFKPKMFVKANQKTEKYECAICNYITQKPYLCRGKCEKYFCFQCINCIKRNTNQCPFKCSKPFDLEECEGVQLEFYCPFTKNGCQLLINSLSKFYQHGQICEFAPENWKQKEENYRKYRCQKGHNLFFLDEQDLRRLYGWNFYDCPTNSICSSCSSKGLCRSLCPQCSEKGKHVLYCTDCRKPPCTKKTCLYQHQMVKQINHSSGLICDFCGTAAYLLGPYAFRDIICNFDICEVCYINLPQTHELVPFKMPKSAISHLCDSQSQNLQDNRYHTFLRLMGLRAEQMRVERSHSDNQSDEQEQSEQQENQENQPSQHHSEPQNYEEQANLLQELIQVPNQEQVPQEQEQQPIVHQNVQ